MTPTKRLTEAMKQQIEAAPREESDGSIAERLGVSKTSVQRYRTDGCTDYVARDNADLRRKAMEERVRGDSRRSRMQEALRQARAAHAEAFAKPLIDAALITPAERGKIRKSVVNRQRWHSALWG